MAGIFNLPHMSGVQLLKGLRELRPVHIPIVVWTKLFSKEQEVEVIYPAEQWSAQLTFLSLDKKFSY